VRKNALIFATVAGLLSACASTPQRNDELERARSQVETLSAEPLAQQAASHDLDAARASLNQADAALAQRKPPAVVDHLAYLARRHADAGQARVDEAQARQEVARGQDERNRILLEARTREAQNAQVQAQAAQGQAEAARSQAQAAQQQLASTQQQLQDLQAKQTERGMVLTLGDVLFDTNKATLKPGADQRLDRLATFLEKNPNERVIIEGYTDSTGSEDYNQELSERRARAVADALAVHGVPASRVQAVGRGQAFPVATNSTQAGRQQNRRVEVVFSDQAGRFAEREAGQQR
jgi:outer membrane protein OmpA-like peptidoglycan-associated protein